MSRDATRPRTAAERAIYAAAFALSHDSYHHDGVSAIARDAAQKEGRDVIECWEAMIAAWSIERAEAAVYAHRRGMRELRDWYREDDE